MATLNQIIYNIRNLVKDAKSDDIKMSDRQYEFIINYLRAKLIGQDIDKGKSISSNIKQDLGNIELAKIDEAQDTILKTNTYTLKSKLKIPKVLELNQKDAITYIGGIDKVSPFQFSTKSNSHWSKHSKYASKISHGYLVEQYLLITNCKKLTRWINVEGIFENPREVYMFKNPNGTYNPNIEEYPLSSKMIQTINDLFKEKELNYFFQLVQDNTNNGQIDPNSQTSK